MDTLKRLAHTTLDWRHVREIPFENFYYSIGFTGRESGEGGETAVMVITRQLHQLALGSSTRVELSGSGDF